VCGLISPLLSNKEDVYGVSNDQSAYSYVDFLEEKEENTLRLEEEIEADEETSNLNNFIDDPAFVKNFVYAKHCQLNRYYISLLSGCGYNPMDTLFFHVKGYKWFKCSNPNCNAKNILQPMVNCGKYHPYTSNKHVGRCANAIMDRLEYIASISKFDYLIKIDLTLPDYVSKEFNKNTAPYLIGQIKKAVKYFLAVLTTFVSGVDKNKNVFGGFYSIHIWKTKDPLGDPHLHVHLTLPNVVLDTSTGLLHRFKPFLNAKDVNLAWLMALKHYSTPRTKIPLWDYEKAKSSNTDVHLGYIKFGDKKRVIHRIKYMYRLPLVDLNDMADNYDTSNVDKDWLDFLLNYTTKRYYVGWFTPVKLKKLGYEKSNRNKSIVQYCPVCGCELQYIGIIDRPPPSLMWFDSDRRGELVEIEPLE